MLIFFYNFIFHKSETRTVLLEVGIDLGLLKKALLKTSKIVLMYSNSLARQFSSMFHAKCLLPRLDELLLLRSCLQNFYQCWGQEVFYVSLHSKPASALYNLKQYSNLLLKPKATITVSIIYKIDLPLVFFSHKFLIPTLEWNIFN